MAARSWLVGGLAVLVLVAVWHWRATQRSPVGGSADSFGSVSKAEPFARVLAAVDPSGTARADVYLYQGREVLYVMPGGFDHFNYVYASDGSRLGAPDGGISGHGDGSLPDWRGARLVRSLRRRTGF